jgi:soluble cytochrome b562
MFDEQKAHGAVRLERARRSAEQVFDSRSVYHP